MAITLTSAQRAALSSRSLKIRDAVLLELDAGDIGFWTGVGDITVSGATYYGVGQMGQASPVNQSGNLTADGIELVLMGLDQQSGFTPGDLFTDLEAADTHGRAATVVRWYFDESVSSAGASDIVLSEQLFAGYIDRVKRIEKAVTLGDQTTVSSTVSVYVESRLMELGRRFITRRTDQHQQAGDFSGDTFFNYAPFMESRVIQWGRSESIMGRGGNSTDPGETGNTGNSTNRGNGFIS